MDQLSIALHSEIISRLSAGTPGDVREAGRLCAQLPEPASRAESYLYKAWFDTAFALEQQGDLAMAADLYRKVVHCEVAEPVYRANAGFRYGLVQEIQGEYKESIAAYKYAIGHDSAWPLLMALSRQQLAGLLILEGRFEEAILHLAALFDDPEYSGPCRTIAWFRYLSCLLKTGRFSLSRDELVRGLPECGGDLDEPAVGIWTEVAHELELANHLELARELYLRLLGMTGIPGAVRTDCYYRLGLMLELLGDWNESMRHYAAAIQAPDEFAEGQAAARFRLAELLYLSENFEGAVKHFEKLRNEPALNGRQRLEAQFRCGVCLLRLARPEDALREFEACRRHAAAGPAGVDVKADLCMAEVFEARKDFLSARKCYQRILQNPFAEPLQKAGAVTRLGQLRSR